MNAEYKNIVGAFCRENGISVKLSHDMPAGYETAYGTYDVTLNTLFLNTAILQNAPKYEVLFYLFHELRHAMQYLCPALFDKQIQESRFYVALYNGVCFKLVDNEWKKCSLEGSQDYFTRAYMNLPYELDANTFAYEKAKEICGDTAELQELYAFWTPKDRLDYDDHKNLFCRIDNKLITGREEMTIKTPRMIIRNFTPEDVADLHEIFGDDETMENCEPAYNFEKTEEFLTSFCIGRNGAVAAEHKESGKMIGYILFNEFDKGVYEMGWIFNRNYWRQGYAYESCKAVIDYAFGELNAHRVFAETIDSVKSINLMKKLGMQLEGIQRSQTKDNHGNWADLYLYSRLEDDRSKQ